MSADGFTQVNSSVYIYTLGRFDLVIDGQPLRFARRAPMRPLELLGALIACGGRSVGIGTLSDLLWPEADGYDAYRAFTTTLHRLRRVLVHPDAVRLSAGRLSLDPQIVQVDVWNFERALRAAGTPDEMAAALDLYRGPFLGDDPKPWALGMRSRLEQSVARVSRELANAPAQPASSRKVPFGLFADLTGRGLVSFA
jgi:LuxR family maltose regulon positive regulatory protein